MGWTDNVGLTERPDGKIEFNGKVYTREIDPNFGLPGWPLTLVLRNLTLLRQYTTYGAKDGGDRRPQPLFMLQGTAKISGYSAGLGVLGSPDTLCQALRVVFHAIENDEVSAHDDGARDWQQRTRVSWPLNVIWEGRFRPETPSIVVAIHVARAAFSEMLASIESGQMESLAMTVRLPGVFVIDRTRPNGPEDELVYLAPFDERGRQPGPNLGYVQDLFLRNRSYPLQRDDTDPEVSDDDALDVATDHSAAAPSPTIDHSGVALALIAKRLKHLLFVAALILAAILIRG